MRRLGFSGAALLLCSGLLFGCGPSEPPTPPPAPIPPPAAQESMVYVFVERGQSLDAIAKTYHVAKQRIIAVNKLSPPFTLKPGLVLAIPLSAIESSPPSQKTVITKPRPPVAADADVPKRARPKQSPDVIPLD
jgi:lipoprotein NlpD